MNVDMRLSEINRFADEVRRLIAASDSAVLRAPSALPDWTRAHVVAHIIGVSHALARHLEYELRDETVEVYDGGQAGRNAEIERVAALSPELLHSRVDTALARLTAAIDAVRLRGDWAAPIVYRDRKSTRLNSSHVAISYAVFCLKKKKDTTTHVSRLVN